MLRYSLHAVSPFREIRARYADKTHQLAGIIAQECSLGHWADDIVLYIDDSVVAKRLTGAARAWIGIVWVQTGI
jgi:hypothetical protein